MTIAQKSQTSRLIISKFDFNVSIDENELFGVCVRFRSIFE